MPEQTFYLNGGLRASMGGKSRVYYKVDLPPNTVEWYYTFTTSSGTTEKGELKLMSQLLRLYDPTGLSSLAASSLMSPTGSMTCDIYLMDRTNADAFIDKADNWGGKYSYVISGSRQNFRNGVVQVQDVRRGTCYLGFKNPSPSEGVYVNFEVAAIVEEIEVDNSQWSIERKQQIYTTFLKALKKDKVEDQVAQDLAQCLIDKIVREKSPEQYAALTEYERSSLITTLYASCSEKYEPKLTPEQEKANSYGTMGWKAYEAGDIDRCIDFSKKALTLESNGMGWVKANLGLCYLIKGEESTATDYYLDALAAIKKEKANVKAYLKAVVDDIKGATKKYGELKGEGYIKGLFEEEIKRLN